MGLLSSLKRKSSEPAARRLPPQDPAQVELLRTRARRRLIGVAVLVGLAVVALPYVFDATPRPARPELTVRMPGEPAEIVMREGTAAGLSPSAEAASAAALQSAVAGSAAAVAASQSPGLSATQMAMAGAGVAAVGAAAGMAVAKAPKDDIITEPRDAQAEARERERQKAAADKAAAEKAERAEKARAHLRISRRKAFPIVVTASHSPLHHPRTARSGPRHIRHARPRRCVGSARRASTFPAHGRPYQGTPGPAPPTWPATVRPAA